MIISENASRALRLKNPLVSTPVRSVIEKVIPRADIDVDDGYFSWANEFALLSRDYITRIAASTSTGRWTQRYPNEPKFGGGGDCHDLHAAGIQLTVDYLQPAGWFIEFFHDDVDGLDGRTLTAVQGDMPILCPNLRSAMQLAEASFPNPHYHVYWHPSITDGACSPACP
jgi:hypothetical protein